MNMQLTSQCSSDLGREVRFSALRKRGADLPNPLGASLPAQEPVEKRGRGVKAYPSGEHLSLSQIQGELLDLLVVFDRLCKANGLRYALAAGTLLGAARHKGFIPWDDDVDVSMPRPDYEKLVALGDALPHGYRVITNRNSPFPNHFAKFQNLRVKTQETTYEGVIEGYLWLDIFPIDGIPSGRLQQERLQKAINGLMGRRAWLSPNLPAGSGLKAAIKRLYRMLHSGPGSIERIDSKISCLAEKRGYRDAEYVSSLLGGTKRVIPLKKKDYENMLTMEFEGHPFPVASCWDFYLTKGYGDYMTPPPEADRASHDVAAWYATADDEVASRRPAQEEGGPHA